jgi:hypothetical protein
MTARQIRRAEGPRKVRKQDRKMLRWLKNQPKKAVKK